MEKEDNLESEFRKKRFKINEFLIGILVGLVLSIITDSFFFLLGSFQFAFSLIIFLFSPLILVQLYVLYVRFHSYPELKEYTIKYKIKDKIDWVDFKATLIRKLGRNCRENHKYIALTIPNSMSMWFDEKYNKYYNYKIEGITGAKLDFFIYDDKETILVLTSQSESGDKLFKEVKNVLDYLKDVFISQWVVSKPEYYHISFFYPLLIKGKKID